MENVEYPSTLILPHSEIYILYEDAISVNKTDSAIIIEGNRNGFMSLANMINVYSSYLFDEITITDFSFVKSRFNFSIIGNMDVNLPECFVLRQGEDSFKWKVSEEKLYETICLIHSLGYANNELHLDSNLRAIDISVYCIVK